MHITRRNLLRTLACAGVSFSLPGLDLLAANRRGRERARSLITLWMDGGPSQLETWDPHPGTKTGGDTKAITTSVDGLQIASTLPLMAEQMRHLSVIRSLTSKEGDHERGSYFVKTGYRPDPTLVHPSIGAVVAHPELKPKRSGEKVNLPMHISLGSGGRPARGGYLGDQYDAFRIFEPGNSVHNMQTPVSEKRQRRRLENLDVVSQAFRRGRFQQVEKSMHTQTVESALAMMSAEQLTAFELEDEPRAKRDAYGDSRFGRGCLIARRLVEVGVRAIEVTLGGFDSHANNFEIQNARAADLDPAFSELVKDLQERDLWESTIVLCIGEFGRTPNINPAAGRDHWPTGFSAVVGGGGLTPGVVLGETDPQGDAKKLKDPIEVQDLYATILAQLGIEYDMFLDTPIGRPMAICEGEPIERLRV